MVLFLSPSITNNDWTTACLVDPTPAAPIAPQNAAAIVAALSAPDQVTVRVGGADVPRVDECPPDGEGWRYLQDAAPYEAIELCAATCEAAHVVASLELEHVCPPEG